MTKELIGLLSEINAAGVARVTERNLQYLILNILSDERRYMCLRSPCGAATNLLGFAPNGDVYPCDDFHGVPEFKIGNIFTDDIIAAVRGGTTACRFTNRSVDSYPVCGNCPWRWVCNAGGCASRRYFATGSLESPDPLCPYFQWLIPQVLLDLASGGIDAIALAHVWGPST